MTRLMIAALLVITAAGCAEQGTDKTVVVVTEPGPRYYVHEVHLRDGTRCVVSTSMRSDGGTGIACDWRSAEEVE